MLVFLLSVCLQILNCCPFNFAVPCLLGKKPLTLKTFDGVFHFVTCDGVFHFVTIVLLWWSVPLCYMWWSVPLCYMCSCDGVFHFVTCALKWWSVPLCYMCSWGPFPVSSSLLSLLICFLKFCFVLFFTPFFFFLFFSKVCLSKHPLALRTSVYWLVCLRKSCVHFQEVSLRLSRRLVMHVFRTSIQRASVLVHVCGVLYRM